MVTLNNFLILGVGLAIALLTPTLAIASIKYRVFPFLRTTYIFWALFSLYNFSLLIGFVIPPLLIFGASFYGRFLPFLLPPLAFSLLVVGGVIFCTKRAFPQFSPHWLGKEGMPVVFNFLLLAIFLLSAEHHKNTLIAEALANHKPDCTQINSFVSSIGHGGQDNQLTEHALFTEGGKTFFWSYSKLDFFEGREELSRNFPCRPAR